MKLYKTLMLISLVASVFASIVMFFYTSHNKDTAKSIEIVKEAGSLGLTNTGNQKYVVVNDDFARGCRQDTDCISVKSDVCGCTAGGKARAIVSWKKSVYLQKLQETSRDKMCVQVMSNDRSCSARPVCDKRLKTCVLSLE